MNEFVNKNAVAICTACLGALVSLATFAFNVGGKSAKLEQVTTDLKEVKQDVKDMGKQVDYLVAQSRKDSSVAAK